MNKNTRFIIFLIITIALLSFLTGLFGIIAIQSKYLRGQKIEDAIINAERLSLMDKTISMERATKIYSENLAFTVFKDNCDPFYSSDLLILTNDCLTRNENYEWKSISGLRNTQYVLGYSSDLALTKYINENIEIVLAISISYLLFVFIITIIFLKFFIEKPITKISSSIASLIDTKEFNRRDFLNSKDTLLKDLYSSILKLIEEVTKLYREHDKLKLSQQIAHDLRAPLSALEDHVNKLAQPDSIESIAIKRIRSIADSLMPSTQLSTPSTDFKISVLNDLVKLYPQIIFSFNNFNISNIERLSIPEDDFFRFMTNIVKNAVESKSTQIEMTLIESDSFTTILILDNGLGIETNLIPQILTGHSTKEDGNGLGISSVYRQLKQIGGDVIIESSPGNGFKLKLIFPLLSKSQAEYILIDDDKLIRVGWDLQAKKKGVILFTFKSVSDFLNFLPLRPLDSIICIDSDLGSGIKGEIESEHIFKMGYKNIYLTTGYHESEIDLKLYPWIKGVAPKNAPF